MRPCHGDSDSELEDARDDDDDDGARAARALRKKFEALWATCPLRGRRLPELSAGDLFPLLVDPRPFKMYQGGGGHVPVH